ncbi:MAG: YqgE/AlgH family protein [Gammaproteobacteria bacterium]|nr:MAG: YqgE/AlgH family protein [Gammaproteobacteria bacterium]
MSENLTKQLLIAMPSMEDPNFSRTVTIICEHNQDGAMGIIINQPTTLFVDELLSNFDVTESNNKDTEDKPLNPLHNHEPVYAGGPVQIDRGFILHDSDKQWESTHMIDNDLSLTTSEDILLAIAQGKGPENTLIALGYAGWEAGQLEQELSANAWLTVPYEADIIFDTPIEKRWQRAATKIGIDLHLISNQAGHA